MDDGEAAALARRLAPLIAQELTQIPTYWGDKGRVHVGEHVTLVNTLFNVVSGEVFIGDYAYFGHNVCVLTGTHAIDSFDHERQISVPTSGRDIHIGRGAWIASNATVIGPCRIGQDAVVGVGSVLIGDARAGWFYAGAPARPIKPVSKQYSDD